MAVSNYGYKVVYTTASKLSQVDVDNGQIIFCQDTNTLYFDFENTRRSYGQIIVLEEDSNRTSLTPVTNTFCYVKATKTLWYYGTSWINITEDPSRLTNHINDTTSHITSQERTNWNAAKTHADSAHAPSNAQANIIETVKVNGTALTPTNKAVNVEIPTDYIISGSQTSTSSADGGSNVYTFTNAEGKTSNFTVKNGSKGSTGATGTRGSLLYWGTAITGTATTGTVFSGSGISSALVGDLYLNTSTWNVYKCTTAGTASAAKWSYQGNIKGSKGDTGNTGATGANGVSVTKVEQTTTSSDDDGTNVITVTLSNGNTSTFNIKNGSKGSTGNTGANGTRGSLLYWGTSITGTNTSGVSFSGSGISSALVNDLYLNTSTWNVYQCTTAGTASVAKWAYKGCIKGSNGTAGSAGKDGADGVGIADISYTPSSADGGNNVLTIITSDDQVYDFNIKNGSKGSTGSTGATGKDGVSVTKVEQTTTSSVDGGTNVVTVTLSNGTTSTFNIKNGSKGSTGNTGATGTRGSLLYWGTAITGTATTGTVFSGSGISSALVNDLYLNTSTWDVYQCTTAGAASAAKWSYKGNIKGAKGDTGNTGATGANGVSVTKVEQTTTSNADAGTNVITVTLSNGTTSTFNIKNGSKGSTGAAGTRGSTVYMGTAITGTATDGTIFSNSGIASAIVNDLYFNTNTWNVYICTTAGAASAAKWSYKGNIKGAKGDTGAAGQNATTTATGTTSISGLTKLYTGTGSKTDGTMTQNAITNVLGGKANTNHNHNYAGSTKPGGSANSAVKLDTASVGSETQPVYFSGGKPTACSYTIKKSVPANANFENTWRGIQDNLTSTSATDSLSANQGKILYDLVKDDITENDILEALGITEVVASE